jgi:sensor histidine kinase regulating citrate/malate metabolism
VSLVFCCFIFIYNNAVQKQESELINLQYEKQKNEINKTFYEMLEKKNEEQKLFAHDMRHHFYALNSMDDINQIKSYLSKIEKNINEYQFIGKTNNKMLDCILSKYFHICKTKNIDFLFDVHTANLSFIDDNDLVSLFGNLLDNAVEATEGATNSYLRLIIKKEKNFDVINVINTTKHPPKQDGEQLITTKKDMAYHGYGIKSIEKIVNKYNGICQWDYDDNIKEFHFNILFNKNK